MTSREPGYFRLKGEYIVRFIKKDLKTTVNYSTVLRDGIWRHVVWGTCLRCRDHGSHPWTGPRSTLHRDS